MSTAVVFKLKYYNLCRVSCRRIIKEEKLSATLGSKNGTPFFYFLYQNSIKAGSTFGTAHRPTAASPACTLTIKEFDSGDPKSRVHKALFVGRSRAISQHWSGAIAGAS